MDIEAFSKSLNHPNKSIFNRWSSTAMEINRKNYGDVSMLCAIYEEIPAEELRPSQVISFLEQLLQYMHTDEEQKSLIRAEALPFRMFA